MRIFYTCHTHIPFQPIGLSRFRKIGRTNIGRMHSRITNKNISLGMKSFDFGMIRNMYFGMR